MLDFLPQTASVLRGDQIVEVDTKTILPGEVVVIRPGGRIPVDGRVLNGHSFVEQAAITGEPMPSEKSAGSDVYAGTINQAGTLQVRAERLGKETTFGKIIEAVENAERSRAPIQKTADRLAGYLVYFALGAAVLTFLITHNLRSTISVIIVAGACGIAAGTPLAILGAIGRAARNGSIIKGGIYLEALGQLQTVFLDKTGTLTYGFPLVSEVRTVAGVSGASLLEAAASAERSSEHPLGRAIVRYAEQQRIAGRSTPKLSSTASAEACWRPCMAEPVAVGNRALFEELGIALPEKQARLDGTEILVAHGGRYYGSILVTDELRPSAGPAVKALSRHGHQGRPTTGDAKAAAEAVADKLGIIQVYAELLPEEKTAFIAEQVQERPDGGDAGRRHQRCTGAQRSDRRRGDGRRNGCGPRKRGRGADRQRPRKVRRNRAYRAKLPPNHLAKLLRHTDCGYHRIGLAAAGFLNPLLAAFIHVASELTFILNSTRLLPPREKGKVVGSATACGDCLRT